MTVQVPSETVAIPRGVGWALISGAVIFWLGAVTPPYRQWTGVPLEEYLAIIAAHRFNWYAIHTLFAVGVVTTLAGMSALHAALSVRRTQLWSAVGSTLWLAAAVLWLVCIAHRLSMTLWAADVLSRSNAIPPGYAATHAWMSLLFVSHMLMSYLALAAFGVALRDAASVPRWVVRTVLAFGLLGVPGMATPVFQPPLMLFVAPCLVGVAIVRQPRSVRSAAC